MLPSARSSVRAGEPPRDSNALTDEVARAFSESGYSELENIRIHAHGEKVVLSGRVSAFYLRQKAEHIALSLAGPGKLESRIHVDNS